MVDIKRFNEISTEEEYKKVRDIVKAISDFNGFFCGECKHKISAVDGLGGFSKFCSNCGSEFNEMPDIREVKYYCKKSDHQGFDNKRNFCEKCGSGLSPAIDDPGGNLVPKGYPNRTSFYNKIRDRV